LSSFGEKNAEMMNIGKLISSRNQKLYFQKISFLAQLGKRQIPI